MQCHTQLFVPFFVPSRVPLFHIILHPVLYVSPYLIFLLFCNLCGTVSAPKCNQCNFGHVNLFMYHSVSLLPLSLVCNVVPCNFFYPFCTYFCLYFGTQRCISLHFYTLGDIVTMYYQILKTRSKIIT